MLLKFSSDNYFKISHQGLWSALFLISRAVFLCLALFIFSVSAVAIYAQTTTDSYLYWLNQPTTAISGAYTWQARCSEPEAGVYLSFDEIPGERYLMSYQENNVCQFSWDSTTVANGAYHARLHMNSVSGETLFSDPLSFNVYNLQRFSWEIMQPRGGELFSDHINSQIRIEPAPQRLIVNYYSNGSIIDEQEIAITSATDNIYETGWPVPAGMSGEIEIEFQASRPAFESFSDIRTVQVGPNTNTGTTTATVGAEVEILFNSPSPNAVIGQDTRIGLESSRGLDSLELRMDGPTPARESLYSSNNYYYHTWRVNDFTDGAYVLRAQGNYQGQSYLVELPLILQKDSSASTMDTNTNSTTTAGTDEAGNSSGADYYIEFASDESLIAGDKRFLFKSNLPAGTEFKARVSGPENGDFRVAPASLSGQYEFWWPASQYPEGEYRLQVEAEYEKQIYGDYLSINYSKEVFIEEPVEIEPYVLKFKDLPPSPWQGEVDVFVSTNRDLDRVDVGLLNPDRDDPRKYATRRVDDRTFKTTIDTWQLADDEYILGAGGTLAGVEKAGIETNIAIQNHYQESQDNNGANEAISDNQNDNNNKTTATDREGTEAAGQDPDSANTQDAKAVPAELDPECRANNILTLAACQRFLELPLECRQAGKTVTVECRLHLNLDERCRELGLNNVACQEFLQLPPDCQNQGIISRTECGRYLYGQALAPECRRAGIDNQKECDEFLSPAETQAADTVPASAVNSACADIGMEDSVKCRAYLRLKFMPSECIAQNIEDLDGCDRYLLETYSAQKCAEAGISDSQECRSFLANKFTQAVSCQSLGELECRQLIKERFLGQLTLRQGLLDQLTRTLQTVKGSISLKDLAQKNEAVGQNLPLQPSASRVRVIKASAGTVLDSSLNLRQSAAVALAYDQDGDGLIDSVEIRLGLDPASADSDSDGFSDLDEIKNGYNPTGAGQLPDGFLAPIDMALINDLNLEQANTAGEEDQEYRVEQIENRSNADNDQDGYVISGQADPDQVLTVYIYSNLPVVATVKSDEFGNWQYELGDLLSEGEHEVYVAVNDNTGRILKKSSPINFFVKEARAVSVDDFIATAGASPQTKTEAMINYYVVMALVIVVVSLLLFFILFLILKNKQS